MTGLFLSLEEYLPLTPEEEAVECAIRLLGIDVDVEYELIPSISNDPNWKPRAPHTRGRPRGVKKIG